MGLKVAHGGFPAGGALTIHLFQILGKPISKQRKKLCKIERNWTQLFLSYGEVNLPTSLNYLTFHKQLHIE